MHINIALFDIDVGTPYMIKQLVSRVGALRVGHEELKQVKQSNALSVGELATKMRRLSTSSTARQLPSDRAVTFDFYEAEP